MNDFNHLKTAGVWNSRISKFIRFANAVYAANYGRKKASMILLGDDSKYWVVCLADGEKLLKAGYECATA